jgi:hypothetical protein
VPKMYQIIQCATLIFILINAIVITYEAIKLKRCREEKAVDYTMNIKKISIKELNCELEKREGVKVFRVMPYQRYKITIDDKFIEDI